MTCGDVSFVYQEEVMGMIRWLPIEMLNWQFLDMLFCEEK